MLITAPPKQKKTNPGAKSSPFLLMILNHTMEQKKKTPIIPEETVQETKTGTLSFTMVLLHNDSVACEICDHITPSNVGICQI